MLNLPEMALAEFRNYYPTGCLTTKLLMVNDGQYVVRAAVVLDQQTVATGLAADQTIEAAEDRARSRALAILNLQTQSTAEDGPDLSADSSADNLTADLPQIQPETMTTRSIKSEAAAPSPLPSVESPSATDSGAITETGDSRAEPADSVGLAEPLPGSGPPPENFGSSADVDPSAKPVDLSDIIAQTDVELSRLGWTSADGREHLQKTYGKRSRQQLTDEELLSFLLHLESLPTPSWDSGSRPS